METDSQPLMELEPPTLKNSDRPRNRHRRRRRSSARFLRLTGRLMEDIDEEEEENENVESDQHLGDMYKRAIRMNAENRINASNSWNLRLIENIDKFLEEDLADSPSPSPTPQDDDGENANPNIVLKGSTSHKQRRTAKEKRVNFTKASCTLDASVKIYSYRVDDVHLTSYKVLANLNRTDNSNDDKGAKLKKKSTEEPSRISGAEEHDELADSDGEAASKTSSGGGNTLETNKANINMSKLDSAFDIDPLFHKMSKTFDEGGAKGLLLVNLGVGNKGCNIVFDSKGECEEETNVLDSVSEESNKREEGMVDITSLITKLNSACGSQAIDSLPLVPQLASLREQHAQLKAGGFVEDLVRASKRYASTQKEEKEADISIHQEALERSRVSHGNLGRSFVSNHTQDDGFGEDDTGAQFAPEDFGGGSDDDARFDDFIALDESGARFSSISFQDSFASRQNYNTQGRADVLLDAICSGNVLIDNEYEYFDTQALNSTVVGNLWAGSQHWKRSEMLHKREEPKSKPKASTKKKNTNERPFIDLKAPHILEDILRKPPKKKGGTNPLQLSKAMVSKYTRQDNILPPDSEIGVEKLAGLFLRPNAMVKPASHKASANGKTVCFDGAVVTFGAASGDEGDISFGGDDDEGPGFALANNDEDSHDEFFVEELKGVRKVDTKQVAVGYATVAKKVDVRRLKKDLWCGIESVLIESDMNTGTDTNDAGAYDLDVTPTKTSEKPTTSEGLSFQRAVREMEEGKTQMDASLPFYFICVLHLANEKGLRLDPKGLEDFTIYSDPTAFSST